MAISEDSQAFSIIGDDSEISQSFARQKTTSRAIHYKNVAKRNTAIANEHKAPLEKLVLASFFSFKTFDLHSEQFCHELVQLADGSHVAVT